MNNLDFTVIEKIKELEDSLFKIHLLYFKIKTTHPKEVEQIVNFLKSSGFILPSPETLNANSWSSNFTITHNLFNIEYSSNNSTLKFTDKSDNSSAVFKNGVLQNINTQNKILETELISPKLNQDITNKVKIALDSSLIQLNSLNKKFNNYINEKYVSKNQIIITILVILFLLTMASSDFL